jgi:hypothetical protein
MVLFPFLPKNMVLKINHYEANETGLYGPQWIKIPDWLFI